jgi:hypothetical protein
MRTLLIVIFCLTSASAYAQPIPPAGDTGDAAPTDTHPVLSTDATWAGSMLIITAGLFLAAMVIGPAVQGENEDELPISENRETAHLTRHH